MPRETARGPVRIADGTLEAIKWLGLLLMTGDHINKYALHESARALFDAGRLVMPMFGFVLSYNLARVAAAARGLYGRMLRRILVVGALSSPAFVALGGLLWGWWPLNIFFELGGTVAVVWCWQTEKLWWRVAAAVTFILVGSSVEFWWPALGMNLCFVRFFHTGRYRWFALAGLLCSTLMIVNSNEWALAAFPVLWALSKVELPVRRVRWAFYAYYPALLYGLLAWRLA